MRHVNKPDAVGIATSGGAGRFDPVRDPTPEYRKRRLIAAILNERCARIRANDSASSLGI
jgi:hypothetical protein